MTLCTPEISSHPLANYIKKTWKTKSFWQTAPINKQYTCQTLHKTKQLLLVLSAHLIAAGKVALVYLPLVVPLAARPAAGGAPALRHAALAAGAGHGARHKVAPDAVLEQVGLGQGLLLQEEGGGLDLVEGEEGGGVSQGGGLLFVRFADSIWKENGLSLH